MTEPLPDIETIAPRILERCLSAAAPISFSTFLVAVRALPSWRELPEHELTAWKRALKVKVGVALWEAWDGKRDVEFQRPELHLTWDAATGEVERKVRPLYLYGRYRKLARGLPQTRAFWRCPTCKGHEPPADCDPCRGTGKRFPVAVEDLLGRAPRAAFDGKDYLLHGMGREDIDVRCLGNGRPFVLEIVRPKRREADLEALAREVEAQSRGQVELPIGLRSTPAAAVARVKGYMTDKTYGAVCTSEGPLDAAAVEALAEALTGVTLEQRTPTRVARRRSDKVRRRTIRSFAVDEIGERSFLATIEAESGTYIKELISSDEGRTVPSVAGLLELPTTCTQLDVLGIGAEDAAVLTFPPA